MKNFIILIVVIFSIKSTKSQTLGDYYVFKQSEIIVECTSSGDLIEGENPVSVPSEIKFKIERLNVGAEKKIVISIARWAVDLNQDGSVSAKAVKENVDNNSYYRGTQGNIVKKFFLITAEQFLAVEHPTRRAKWNFATGSTIVKYRPGSKNIPAEIGNDFNVGLLVAISFDMSKEQSLHFLFGTGVGAVKLTPFTTNNFLTEDVDVASFSPTIGLVHQVKGGQIGIMSGIDLLSGSAYKHWHYRGRPWIGVGIGFNLFKISSSAEGKN